jgi:anti-anti-sigma factor
MRQLVDDVVLHEDGAGTTVTLTTRLRRTPDEESESALRAPGATIEVDRTGARPVVRASGPADESSAEQLRIRLLEASHGGTVPVELDVRAASLFSSAAVRVVLAIARISRDEGWRLVVHTAAGSLSRHVLEISGLGDLVDLR